MVGSENLKKPYIKSAIDERLAVLESQKIAKQDEVLQVFTSILRQELTEEITEINQATGELVTYEKKPSIAEVIKAGSELMKRYPTALELQKLNLEIEKLKTQVTVDNKTELALDKLFDKLEEEINGN